MSYWYGGIEWQSCLHGSCPVGLDQNAIYDSSHIEQYKSQLAAKGLYTPISEISVDIGAGIRKAESLTGIPKEALYTIGLILLLLLMRR